MYLIQKTFFPQNIEYVTVITYVGTANFQGDRNPHLLQSSYTFWPVDVF